MTTTDAEDPRPPRTGTPDRRRPGLGRPRVVWISFAISAALHLAAIVIYPTLFYREVHGDRPFRLPISGRAAEGMQAIQLVEVASEGPQAPAEPDQPEETQAAPADVSGPVVRDEAEQGGLVEPGRTAAERLRPDLRDERLWAPVDPDLVELTPKQRLQLDLAVRLEAYRDSARAAAESELDLTDWTYTDGEGRKWGVSEGKIHLGGLTLPLPFGFGVNPGRRDAVQYREWEWEQLQRQQIEGGVHDSWKERAKAIRERRDRERQQARPDSAGVHLDR
jgi:hypothetical protein